jgi:ATP-dependent DNA helicase RecG
LKLIADECDTAGVRYEFRRDHVGFTTVFFRPDLSGFEDSNAARMAATEDILGGTPQDTPQERTAKLLAFLAAPRTREEMQQFVGLTDRKHFREKVLKPLLDSGQIEMTMPDKPTSRLQKYVHAQP